MKKLIIYSALIAFLLLFIGIYVPLQILFYLFFGWILFLFKSISRVQLNIGLILLFVSYTAAFFVLLHFLAKGWKFNSDFPKWKIGWSVSAALLILVAFTAGISITGIVHQLYWIRFKDTSFIDPGSMPAKRTHSKNNLKTLGLAAHLFHDEHQTFPNYGFNPEQISYPSSWETKLLPFMEQNSLYEKIDFTVPWNHSKNKAFFKTRVPVFINPAISNKGGEGDNYSLSHYSANVLIFARSGKSRIKDIHDGTGNTIFGGEISERLPPWGKPQNWRDPSIGLKNAKEGFMGPYPVGTNFLLADGTVRFISNNIDPEVLKALSTPAGGEPSQTY